VGLLLGALEPRTTALARGAKREIAVLTDGEITRVEALARRLTWYDPLVAAISGFEPDRSRGLTLVLFQSRDAYRHYAPHPHSSGHYTVASAKSLALIDGSGPWSEMTRIALHEYVHHFLAGRGGFPVWYQEGLAEYLASLRIADGWIELGGADPLRMNLLRGRASMPLPALVAGDTASAYYDDPTLLGRFHDTAWSLFHYLRLGRQHGREGLTLYLEQLHAGMPSVPALEIALGASLATLQQELASYLENEPLPFERLPGERFRIARPRVGVRSLERAEVSALLSELGSLRRDPGEKTEEAATGLECSEGCPRPSTRGW
jgi:hypothetical protein